MEERRRADAEAGYTPVKSYNPWWDDGGKTFEDVDGYRVVLHNDDGIIGTQ